MRAVNFVTETLSHFARDVKGPPPGVPFAADAEFETDLVALCEHQRLSTMVSASFDELALPPTVSRITIARLNYHADLLVRRSERRSRLAVRVSRELAAAGVPVALLGEVWGAARGAAAPWTRPVGPVDAMIHEQDWSVAVGVLRGLGFVRSRIQPRLADWTHALRYHQYFSPLIMHNQDGDTVRLRFRVIDFGDPGRDNPAWSRVGPPGAGEATAPTVGAEDQFIHSLISFASEGFVDLLAVFDAGRLLFGSAGRLDWEYVARRLKDRGYHDAFYFTLEHACERFNLPRATGRLDAPPRWRRRLFHAFWHPGEADYYGETEPTGGRFSFGLIEGAGALARARWIHRSLFARSAWVRSVYGRPANLWLRLKFLHDVRSGRRRRNADAPDTQGSVTGINELR